ncbi:MAG: RnfABCDGE type electron transport complex subunit D [Oscillospiraceae bacterium]|nr:RnfABCDGE type electron transport complex subunit D [Oscillospiraceae bacterium]
MSRELIVSSSPHVKVSDGTSSIMLDVIIALAFPIGITVFQFGPRAAVIAAVSAASCVAFEYLYRRMMKKPGSISDLSAVVTGLLIAMCLPASVPYWMPVVGAFFAIVVVKQLFGGLGKNFMNPALAARAFLLSWPAAMTAWTASGVSLPLWDASASATPGADAVAAATPLASLKTGIIPNISLPDMFLGHIPGSMGEVSAVMLLLGGFYLWVRGVISLRIPLSYMGTVAALTFAFAPAGADRPMFMLYHLLSGGLILGAVFMATDYSTSPVTRRGQVLFGVGCGLLTVFIRFFGSLPEGVCFSILIMNACAWLLDKAGRPRRFGARAKRKGGIGL